MVRLIFYFQT